MVRGAMTSCVTSHWPIGADRAALVATLDRYVDELVPVRGGVTAVLAMLDRAEFLYLCHTPEVLPETQARALVSGQQRLATWRRAVASLLKAFSRARSLAPGGDGAT
jgi:hypothetical protein